MRLRITRRDCVLITITALVVFAIAIPLSSATTSRTARQFTVWPGNDARFANLDWNCHYYTGRKGIECGRESTGNGVRVEVTGEQVWVYRCKAGASVDDCTRNLLRAPRTP